MIASQGQRKREKDFMVMKLNLTNDNFVFGIISNIISSLFYIMKAESRKQKASF
ncbi:hypothetical protein [Brachyspira aalborgi]|uniref:hypothetical protein n=1 Tax=Brachyspira aalborgi TaxID=29522 RepID=UPI00131512FF|nr:hypothetical protein [Brachyspira aalborgi]